MGYLNSGLGRSLGALVAASLLMGVSAEAGAANPDKGTIRLQLGASTDVNHVGNRFVFLPGTDTPGGTGSMQERFAPWNKCYLSWTAGDPDLVDLAAFGPRNERNPQLGLGPDSIGVYDNGKGVSCYRMTASISEGIVFGLGAHTRGSSIGANAFDRLELDMEIKQDAVFKLTILGGGSPRQSYFLRSGTSIAASTIPGTTGESNPTQRYFNCGAASDSGPDSGANDNCRWIINDIGDGFRLEPTVGEGSLEGGGDHGADAYVNNTTVHLTYLNLVATGTLGCTATNNTTPTVGGGPVTSCQVTRINATNLAGQGTPTSCLSDITYRLETFLGGDSRCRLDKTNDPTDQLAGSIQITFEPETRVAWDGVAKSSVTFTKPDGSQTDEFFAELCGGTVVDDANGNETILEVLARRLPGSLVGGVFRYSSSGSTVLTDANDLIPGNGFIDWACVHRHQVEDVGGDLMQVTQTILYWGDISFSRTGPGG